MSRYFLIAGAPASIDYTDNDGQNTTATTHTFTSKAIGAASPRRTVIVPVFYAGASALTVSMTIGGVTAAQVHTAANAPLFGSLFAATVPTGTTANIVVNFSTAAIAYIGVWAAYNLRSNTPNDTSSSPLDLDILAGGVAMGAAFVNDTSSWTWTGLTEDFDAVTSLLTLSGASIESAAPASLSITATSGSAFTKLRLGAAFR